MTGKATLDDFEVEKPSDESRSLTLEERLLTPISPSVGLRLIPGRGDPFYLQNRSTERYLFRDEHGRWFILKRRRKTRKKRSSVGCISQQTGPNGWRSRRFVDGR